MKHTTDTSGRSLVPEDHYDNVMISKIVRKDIKGFTIYEWSFETLVNDKEFTFKLGFFTSQMADLLRVLGGKEVLPGKFDWDDEDMVGQHLSFNVVHVADKKGVIREQLSDIKLVTGVTDPSQIPWKE